mmetsp:Transcript_26602/g.40371  ORF Transcript_26602/g.40371 Transcript_26602/m.40371 type:complete len:135 (+) Transcript_26602:156-560(+)
MSATSSWPPESLVVNTEAIVDECEFAEISAMDRPLLAPVHMAALLYLGETVHARHLWRRTEEKNSEILNDWWEVGKRMMEGKDGSEALERCRQHPAPLNNYANEMAARQPITKKPSQQTSQEVISFLETKRWNV